MESLPDEALLAVLSRLPVEALLLCRAVCRRWRDLALHPDAWRHRDLGESYHRHVLPVVLRLAPCLRRLKLYGVTEQLALGRCAVASLDLSFEDNGVLAAFAIRLLAARGDGLPHGLRDLTVGGCETHNSALLLAVLDLRGLERLRVCESREMRKAVTSLPGWVAPPASLRRLEWRGKLRVDGPHCCLLALLRAHAPTLREVALHLATLQGAAAASKTVPVLRQLQRCERLESVSIHWQAPEQDTADTDSDDGEAVGAGDEEPQTDPQAKDALQTMLRAHRLTELSLTQDFPSDLHAFAVDCIRELAAPGECALTRLVLLDGSGSHEQAAQAAQTLVAALPVLPHLAELEVEHASDALLGAVDPRTLPGLRWLFSGSVRHSSRAWAHRPPVTAFLRRNPRTHLGLPMRGSCSRHCADCRLPCYCLMLCDSQDWSCVALFAHGPGQCSLGGHGGWMGRDCPVKSVRLAAAVSLGSAGSRLFTWYHWPVCAPTGDDAPLQGRVDMTQCLPDTVLVSVFRLLPVPELLLCRAVCRRWRDLALHPAAWCDRTVKAEQEESSWLMPRSDWQALSLAPCLGTLALSLRKVSPSVLRLAATPCAVRRLKISCLFLEDKAGEKSRMRHAFQKIIRRQAFLQRLKHLDISCGEWPTSDSWLQTMYRLPGLESLDVSDSWTGSTLPVPTSRIVPTLEGSHSLRIFKWSGPVLYGHVLDVLSRHSSSLEEVSLTTWFMWEGLLPGLRCLAYLPQLRAVHLNLSSSKPARATTRLLPGTVSEAAALLRFLPLSSLALSLEADLRPAEVLAAVAEAGRARLEKLLVHVRGGLGDPECLQALCAALPCLPYLRELTVDSLFEEPLLAAVSPESTPLLRMLKIEANPLPPHCTHLWLHRPAVRACLLRNARLHVVVTWRGRAARCLCGDCAGLGCYCMAHTNKHRNVGFISHPEGADEICLLSKPEIFREIYWVVIS